MEEKDIVTSEESPVSDNASASPTRQAGETGQHLRETPKRMQESVPDSDSRPGQQLTLKSVLGGDFLTAGFMRSQVGVILLVVAFTLVYIGFRYQCQQDMVSIRQLEIQLKDAKNKALAASSTLTEKCRESRVLETLRQNNDTLLHIADQPPYIIPVPEN